MESVSKIRVWILTDGRSILSVSRQTGLSRNTIKKYLKDGAPPSYRRQGPPARHKLCNGYDTRLQALFEQDMQRPKRDRRTGQQFYEQLVLEGYTGSYSTVQRFVRSLRQANVGTGDAFIPLRFAPGDALQFDWSEERVVLGGVEQRIKVAHFRLCHSRKPFVMAYPGGAQEMVLDALNAWLRLRCMELAERSHPEQRDRSIADLFADEAATLRPLGRDFDGYVEKPVRVRSTCLVQYESNRYEPCHHALQGSRSRYAPMLDALC